MKSIQSSLIIQEKMWLVKISKESWSVVRSMYIMHSNIDQHFLLKTPSDEAAASAVVNYLENVSTTASIKGSFNRYLESHPLTCVQCNGQAVTMSKNSISNNLQLISALDCENYRRRGHCAIRCCKCYCYTVLYVL